MAPLERGLRDGRVAAASDDGVHDFELGVFDQGDEGQGGDGRGRAAVFAEDEGCGGVVDAELVGGGREAGCAGGGRLLEDGMYVKGWWEIFMYPDVEFKVVVSVIAAACAGRGLTIGKAARRHRVDR